MNSNIIKLLHYEIILTHENDSISGVEFIDMQVSVFVPGTDSNGPHFLPTYYS